MDRMHGQNNGVLCKCYTGVTTGVSSEAVMKIVRAYPRLRGPFSSIFARRANRLLNLYCEIFGTTSLGEGRTGG